MDCIILDDDDDVVIPVDTEATAVDNDKKVKAFEKLLIRQVRLNRIIYDNKHKSFSNIDKKEIVWQNIAKKLKSDVDTCKTTWIELRYKYQCFVRRLRKHYIQKTKRSSARPSMNLESELIYLFRFIENRKYCPIPYEIVDPVKDDELDAVVELTSEPESQPMIVDDDLIIIEQPVELIVIDEDDEAKNVEKSFKVTKEMRTLVGQIKKYPELYDSTRSDYTDYSRKSYLWNAIAIQIGDKATKLMKCWILMSTRYEWEISRTLQNTDVAKYQTELQKELEFFEPFILANPETVYKQSYYLKQAWCEPIDYFKEIYNLIVRMKKIPDIVFLTDSLLMTPDKSEQFFTLWGDISKIKGKSTPGECETTWLIMRLFYWELMNMRQHNYQLTDKWYFETIITELYEMAKESPMAKQAEAQKQQSILNRNTPSVAAKSKFQYLNKTPSNSTINLPIAPQQIQLQTEQGPLPKITSAISLAPQLISGAGVNGSLQIKPITSNVDISPPQPAAVLNGSLLPSSSVQPIQLPYALPDRTQVSAVKKPTSIASHSTASNVKPNIKTAMMAAATGISKPPSNMVTTSAPQVDLAPMVCINTAIKSASVGSITLGSAQKSTTTASSTSYASTSNSNSIPIASTTITSEVTAPPAPLPKISGAISLLNPNEILIELIASPNGNHLVVHGPPLSEKYHLSMPTVARFIREAMAIPLLHTTRHNQQNLINSYWEHMSNKFNLPPHICRACWNFLVDNFNHFPQIAPLKELMKPFHTTLKVWTQSAKLFNGFNKHAVSNGWLAYMPRLPEVVDCISSYPILYKDVGKNTKDITSDMESLCVWRTIGLRFPNINDITTIWTAFKNVFCQYMSDIELGIDNKWHINWWRVLARMKFLVETRYSTNEPYYYIVSNKMVEEIDRCAMIEMKSRYGNEAGDKVDQKPSTSNSSFLIDVETNSLPKQEVELVTLLTAIEKYPIIFEKADCLQKFEAWKNVARELQMEVTDCLLAFRRACQKYCAYRKQDASSRCTLNCRYYKRFEKIFRNAKVDGRRKLNIKTPFELNNGVGDGTNNLSPEFVYPERYISDINMSNSDSNLVVKNWIYGFGQLTPKMDESNCLKLKAILKKYNIPHSMSKTMTM